MQKKKKKKRSVRSIAGASVTLTGKPEGRRWRKWTLDESFLVGLSFLVKL